MTAGAQAGLVNLGDGTVKDDTTNLIWLVDWNINGDKSASEQNDWAENGLDGFAGSNDWKLPTIAQFSDLFAKYAVAPFGLAFVAPFENVQPEYWALPDPVQQLVFRPYTGNDVSDAPSFLHSAVAVRMGTVDATVPEPSTVAMVLLALVATAAVRRTRRN